MSVRFSVDAIIILFPYSSTRYWRNKSALHWRMQHAFWNRKDGFSLKMLDNSLDLKRARDLLWPHLRRYTWVCFAWRGWILLSGNILKKYLQELGCYSDINARCVPLILTTDQQRAGICPAYFFCIFLLGIHISLGETPQICSLSDALRVTIERIATGNIGENMKSAGLTPELQKVWADKRSDPAFYTIHDFWFIWSRKKM